MSHTPSFRNWSDEELATLSDADQVFREAQPWPKDAFAEVTAEWHHTTAEFASFFRVYFKVTRSLIPTVAGYPVSLDSLDGLTSKLVEEAAADIYNRLYKDKP